MVRENRGISGLKGTIVGPDYYSGSPMYSSKTSETSRK